MGGGRLALSAATAAVIRGSPAVARPAPAGRACRGVANRRALASLVGSLQFCAVLVHGGQLHLREAYKARDCFTEDTAGQTSKQKWRKHVQVNVTDGLVSDFTFWRTALAAHLPQQPEEHVRVLAGKGGGRGRRH